MISLISRILQQKSHSVLCFLLSYSRKVLLSKITCKQGQLFRLYFGTNLVKVLLVSILRLHLVEFLTNYNFPNGTLLVCHYESPKHCGISTVDYTLRSNQTLLKKNLVQCMHGTSRSPEKPIFRPHPCHYSSLNVVGSVSACGGIRLGRSI